ncbi:DUF2771 family protein [Haloechinothrix sp. LS1_15]|uniref:DUF2771 family protein n=1 Tax=Haloechinothrix sp. LS1_15 TaxID=2652248 RepID=UPI00294636B5|nr:DUF2771 family protein [Haloechinothrix sp. LS1_15]MDV6014371.1 DUF2771 family protein [Haloechinothrix sp. LS1_15]
MARGDARSRTIVTVRTAVTSSRARIVAVSGAAALALAGCGEVGPPDMTVYSDGETVTVEPSTYCDVHVTECDSGEPDEHTLPTRPGEPAQISVPGEVAETPWLVNVQAADADGTPLPIEQEFFSPGESYAFTAEPPSPEATLLVVEVQQLGAAYAADQAGEPILDEQGAMQAVARGIWPITFEPRD